jgi:hypothetical protein
MTAIITNNFRFLNAECFKKDFDGLDVDQNRYLFIGKITPWTNDTQPPLPLDSVEAEFRAWDDMLALKRITDSTVSNVLPRINWDSTGETVYVAYDSSDVNIFNHPTPAEVSDGITNSYTPGNFYVVTDEYNVYKCIDNNNGAKSTVKPTGTGTSIFETLDGYKWKFMYQINSTELLKYFTNDWMPVKHLEADDGSFQWTVQQAAISGSIDYVNVTSEGSGYVFTNSDTAQTAVGNTITLGGSASGSNDVYNLSTIYIISGMGVGQVKQIIDYDGASKTATVDSVWVTPPDNTSVYEVLPSVTITGNGSGAQAKAVVSANKVIKINMIAPGSNYSYASLVVQGGGGSGAVAYPILAPKNGHGSNPVKELGGFFVMLNVKLEYNEGLGDFPITNDYRRLGIVANVLDSSDNIATLATLRATKKLTVSALVGTFQPDEEIVAAAPNSPTGIVVEFTDLGGGNAEIHYYQDATTGFEAFGASLNISGGTSSATATVDTVAGPEVKPRSGDIIYIEQRRPIMRAPDQLEDIKLIVEF